MLDEINYGDIKHMVDWCSKKDCICNDCINRNGFATAYYCDCQNRKKRIINYNKKEDRVFECKYCKSILKEQEIKNGKCPNCGAMVRVRINDV